MSIDRQKTDIHGVEWAKLSETRVGDMLRADDGFDCINTGALCTVKADVNGELYVDCAGGEIDEQGSRHYLDGQCDDGDHMIGFYKT